MAEAEQSSEDYCALMFRGNKDSTRGLKKKLYLINSQPAVVSVIERCLEMFNIWYTVYSKSSSTTAFKFRKRPFGRCRKQNRNIRKKERFFIIIYWTDMIMVNDK